MTWIGLLQIVIYVALVVVCTPLLGNYMAKVFQGEMVFLSPVVRPLERGFYRLAGVDEQQEMSWQRYMAAMLLFSVAGALATYALLRGQARLPLNPDHMPGIPGYLAWQTAISFATNTNWQNYGGEATMSYLSQILALMSHHFMSAASCIALAVAVIRGFMRHSGRTLGSFWADITRTILYILLPICMVITVVFVAQGIPQTLSGAANATTLEGAAQTVTRGPVASWEAVKMIGTNGGGWFNTNSAHPFENPSPLTNLIELVMIVAIPFAMVWTFGRMVGNVKQGIAIASAMTFIIVVGLAVAVPAEKIGNPAFTKLGISQSSTGTSPGGNMEGKEVRFGPILSAVWATVTTSSANGSVNAFHDSFTPLGGLVPMVNIQLGEIAPGAVGSGLYGMLIFAIVAVFVGGLMVGRTPEYLGKKLGIFEVKMAALAVLIPIGTILAFTAVSVVIPKGLSSILNPGPHGFSEILYAFSSQTNNNGSAFAGLTTNTNYYNITGGIAIFLGHFVYAVPILALAGSVVRKPRAGATAGTLPTDTPLFAGLLVGVVVIIAALTYFPALSLGPIVEHLRMAAGTLSG